MHKKFTELKEGESVWVIYDLNWDKDDKHPAEYSLQQYPILQNRIDVPRERNIADRFETPEYITEYENFIEISFNFKKYSRYYTKDYNDYQHMPMHCDSMEYGPWIDTFADYDIAKEFLKTRCEDAIKRCNTNIEKLKYEIELLEKSLNQIKDK